MRQWDITRLIILVMIILIAIAVIYYFLGPVPPQYTSSSSTTETPLTNPNQIQGLDISASEYQVFITYTPEPGAKTMRVEYITSDWRGYALEPFDFELGSAPVSATLQRDVYFGVDGRMRITIIYENNIIKFVEFQT